MLFVEFQQIVDDSIPGGLDMFRLDSRLRLKSLHRVLIELCSINYSVLIVILCYKLVQESNLTVLQVITGVEFNSVTDMRVAHHVRLLIFTNAHRRQSWGLGVTTSRFWTVGGCGQVSIYNFSLFCTESMLESGLF